MFFHRIAHSSFVIDDGALVAGCADAPVNSSTAYGLLCILGKGCPSVVFMVLSCEVSDESLADDEGDELLHSWGSAS